MDTCNSQKPFIILQMSCNESHSVLFYFIYIGGGKGYGGENLFWSEFYEEKGNNKETLNVKYATYFIEIALFCLDFLCCHNLFIMLNFPQQKNFINYSTAILGTPFSGFGFNPWEHKVKVLGIITWYFPLLFFFSVLHRIVLLRLCSPHQL